MKKRILVTGAGGYIGRHVVDALLARGAEVIAADIHTQDVNPKAQRVEIDIFAEDAQLFEKLGSPDVCLHMAWRDGFVHQSNLHMECLSLHARFVRQMLEGGLKQIAVMGTMHEIGYFEGEINDDTPCNPISMYGIAKDALRRYTFLKGAEHQATVQWLRAFYIFGDDKRNNSIFAKLLRAAENGQETFPFTSGKNQYDFIHVRDLAAQLAACVMQDEVNGIINCCSGRPVSLGEQVEGFIREHGLAIRLEYGKFPDRKYDSPAIWGSAEKINRIMRGEMG